jgi:hypothetical protein
VNSRGRAVQFIDPRLSTDLAPNSFGMTAQAVSSPLLTYAVANQPSQRSAPASIPCNLCSWTRRVTAPADQVPHPVESPLPCAQFRGAGMPARTAEVELKTTSSAKSAQALITRASARAESAVSRIMAGSRPPNPPPFPPACTLRNACNRAPQPSLTKRHIAPTPLCLARSACTILRRQGLRLR